ncbi:hypothetical protein ACSFC1_02955 [Pseudothermotoga sp. U03pept]|uniref:hypothetical protein n=1 Tax=Pseudothermotoga sp. U03pept TaxID=3447012 RepID=UPI003F0C66B6
MKNALQYWQEGGDLSTVRKSFRVSLRLSFFKNQLYQVNIKSSEIQFKCLEQEDQSFSIPLDQIRSVSVYGNPPREVEICTNNRVIFGNFRTTGIAHRAIEILRQVFGVNFVQIHS